MECKPGQIRYCEWDGKLVQIFEVIRTVSLSNKRHLVKILYTTDNHFNLGDKIIATNVEGESKVFNGPLETLKVLFDVE